MVTLMLRCADVRGVVLTTQELEEMVAAPAALSARHLRRRPRWLEPLLVVVIGAVAGLLALAPFASAGGHVGPGRVRLNLDWRVGGGSHLLLPPLGKVTAHTHRTPLGLDVRVDEIDFDKLEHEIADGNPREQLRNHVDHDLHALLPRLALRAVLVALVAGALAAAVLPRRRGHHMALGGAGGVVVVVALLTATSMSFHQSAFDHPRFEGSLARIPSAFAAVQRGVEQLGGTGRFSGLSRQVADLYAGTASQPPDGTAAISAGGPGETRILHVSDVHSNPIGLEVARQLAAGFHVDAVLDTGDLTSFGLPMESQLSSLIADFPVPYYFVPGNHDSHVNREALGAAKNVHLLDGTAATVGGVRIVGVGDPTFTALGTISNTEATATRLAAAPEVEQLVEREKADVLAVHDPVLATRAFGHVPLVLAGHLHHRQHAMHDGTRELVVGSTGATGLGSFTVRTRLPYEAEVLHFKGPILVATDYITMQGVGGNLRIDRELAGP